MTATQKTPATLLACPKCGFEGEGNFCSFCGARLKWEPLRKLTSYHDIINDERCQRIIQEEAVRAKSGMGSTGFLQYAELVFAGRLPLAALAALSGKAGQKLDFGRENYGFMTCRQPFSYAVLALLCSFARESLIVKNVMEDTSRCLIEATIPSSIWSLEGKLEAIIVAEEGNTRVLLQAKIFGQWIDWGKTRRLTSKILKDIKRLGTEFRQRQDLK